MAIPDYQTLMLPVLKVASDRKEHKFRDAVELLADEFSLSSEERNELLPSGNQPLFNNRVGWARSYLKQAGLLAAPKRGFFTITERGLELLATNPSEINTETLSQYPEFLEFRNRRKPSKEKGDSGESEKAAESLHTPEDALASAYQKLRKSLESELLTIVKEASPSFFEKLVVDLLVNMGYGGNRQDAGKALGKSGDGGIDGIINEDRLGLDVIFIQAKRWEGPVGRPEIQKFAGALQGQRAKKGVFITSSSFTKAAEEYVSLIDTRIILIDGERLGRLMVDHNVGVSTVGKYEVKKVDSDYFDNE
ncbi:restriction endonuclease [Maridesulfovibrio sp.]|uniref:restriction endonuclease n=1 Tax=Maridesulfovibrio sp. TaxID=2795000 RepID=UPI002A18AA4C|nr:restriction endonuclease [Maridesulfovibrio sp.]